MTPTGLRRKALEKLQVLAAGESAHASAGQVVQDKYEDLHEILTQDNLIDWVVTDEIPDAYKSVIVNMVAAECVDEFYCPDNLKLAILQEGKYGMVPPSMAERRLRKL